jgi:PadR family transcriptional regulator, regulatory protein PadR
MRAPTVYVLSALVGRRLHGYAVIAEVAQLSAGSVRLQPGALYATLERLVADGLVEVAGEEVVNGRHRRYYTLTGAGATVLAEQSEQLQRAGQVASRRLNPGAAPA